MTKGNRRTRRALAAAVEQIIVAAPSAPHRIQDLADRLGVSPFQLSRFFRAETGASVHQYLLRIRMAHALARLEEGEEDLSRLALDLGFSSHSHFSEVFRRHFGQSPSRVRAGLRRPDGPSHTSRSGFVHSTMGSLETLDRVS